MVSTQTQIDESSIFRILVSTDNHVGYKERDPVRNNDSFEVLEETFRLAVTVEADFILHGGDLFDMHKPSRNTMYRTMCLFRKYVFGHCKNRPTFRILNKDTRKKIFKFGEANFERFDSDTVSLPVFGIHGNHDDPSEEAFLSPIDILEAANMLTYFGWVENLDAIELHPILLQKGSTKIALYGLGNIRDERLHRTFQNGKVQFCTPEFGTTIDYFNLMVIHQNRYKGCLGGLPNKNCIHDQMLPKMLDLVIWGHEHDCIVSATESIQADFHIIQPGSSIATSLTSGEAQPKHLVLLEIRGDSFRSTFLPLRCIRPLEVYEVILAEKKLFSTTEDVIINCLTQVVNGLILESKKQWKNHLELWEQTLKTKIFSVLGISDSSIEQFFSWPNYINELGKKTEDNYIPLPCIRIRVEHSGYEAISSQRFGAPFIGRVANPDDMLLFFKKRHYLNETNIISKHSKDIPELQITDIHTNIEKDVQDLTFTYLGEDASLELFPEPEFNIAVQHFVHKMETSAIERFVTTTIKDTRDTIKKTEPLTTKAQDVRNLVVKVTDSIRHAYMSSVSGSSTSNVKQENDYNVDTIKTHLINEKESNLTNVKLNNRKRSVNKTTSPAIKKHFSNNLSTMDTELFPLSQDHLVLTNKNGYNHNEQQRLYTNNSETYGNNKQTTILSSNYMSPCLQATDLESFMSQPTKKKDKQKTQSGSRISSLLAHLKLRPVQTTLVDQTINHCQSAESFLNPDSSEDELLVTKKDIKMTRKLKGSGSTEQLHKAPLLTETFSYHKVKGIPINETSQQLLQQESENIITNEEDLEVDELLNSLELFS